MSPPPGVEVDPPAAGRHGVPVAHPVSRWPGRSDRDRAFPSASGLALWERYTRAALAGLAGHAGYVMGYEDLLADPRAALEPLAHWLAADRRVPVSQDDEPASPTPRPR